MSVKYGYILNEDGTTTPQADPGAVQRGEVVAMAADSEKLGGKQVSDFVKQSQIANNFVTTEEGFVADARALKTLMDVFGGVTAIAFGSYTTPSDKGNLDHGQEIRFTLQFEKALPGNPRYVFLSSNRDYFILQWDNLYPDYITGFIYNPSSQTKNASNMTIHAVAFY